MKKYVCSVCGYVYDEAAGISESGIAPGTKLEDLSDGWVCPVCGAPVDVFEVQDEIAEIPATAPAAEIESTGELSPAALGAVFSNLSKGCEKQFREEESLLFAELSAYFDARSGTVSGKTFDDLGSMLRQDISNQFSSAVQTSSDAGDRGALRALTWSEKVSRMQASILKRFAKEGTALLEDTNIHVCEICGFIYIGDEPPDLCPVCKVQRDKITTVVRG